MKGYKRSSIDTGRYLKAKGREIQRSSVMSVASVRLNWDLQSPNQAPLAELSALGFMQMLAKNFIHLEHVDFINIEYGFHACIAYNFALVGGIL